MKAVQTESPAAPEVKFPATVWNGAGLYSGGIFGDQLIVIRWVQRGTPPTHEAIRLPVSVSEVLSVDLAYPAIMTRDGSLYCLNRGTGQWERVGSLAESR